MERGGGNAPRTGGMQCPSCSLSCLFGKTRSQHPCAPLRGDTCLPPGARRVPRDRSMSLRLSAVRREFLICFLRLAHILCRASKSEARRLDALIASLA